MTQEQKELVLKDLCARLCYGVMVDITYSKEHGSSYRLRICSEGCLTLDTDLLGLYIEDEIYLKPYLRPMSSMTEEERTEIEDLNMNPFSGSVTDWLNKKGFDYRDLIPLGLALPAPKNMYK